MLQRADSLGVFQVESRAQMSMLPRLQAGEILRSRHRGRDRAAGPDPGRHGASLSAPPAGTRAGLLSVEGARSRARQDARRAAVPGAGDEDRHRRRRLHAGRGRQAAPRHGDLQAHRHHRHVQDQDDRGHGRAAAIRATSPSAASARSRASANTAFRKATPRASRCWSMPRPGSSAAIRTSSPRRCSTRSRWASTRRRRSCATCASTASRCGRSTSIIPTGTRRWSRARAPPARLHRAPPRHGGRHPHDACAAAGLAQDQGTARGATRKLIVANRGARLRLRARSVAAHRPAVRASSSGWPTPMPSARSASPGGRRCGRRRRSAASATRTTICRCFASSDVTDAHERRARRNRRPPHPPPQGEGASTHAMRPTRARGPAAADAARRGGRERLPVPRAVAARASGVVPARRPRPARHHPQRGAARVAIRRARHRLRPRHHPPAAGLGQWRHLHDHRGRDGRSPTSSSGRRRSSASARSSWARAMSP